MHVIGETNVVDKVMFVLERDLADLSADMPIGIPGAQGRAFFPRQNKG